MRKEVWMSAAVTLALLGPLPASAQDGGGWDYKPMAKALHQFLGQLSGPYMQTYPPLVSAEILDGMNGSSYPAVELPGGRKLVSGCRKDSCDEKAAVILSSPDKVEAAAIISPHCHWTKPPHRTRRGNLNGPSACDHDDTVLTVFARKTPAADGLDQALKDWARRVVPESKAMPHEVVWVK